MLAPAQLESASFDRYPTAARQLAVDSLPVLQKLPLAFAPFLLKEIVTLDFKFPVEARELNDQLGYLRAMPAAELSAEMKPFAGLSLNEGLKTFDWVNAPGQFLEQLSAHLWATHQMEVFRPASEKYVHRFHDSLKPETLPAARVSVVVIGRGVDANVAFKPFVKIQREGTLFTKVNPDNALTILQAAVQQRQQAFPIPYAHWCIHGGLAPEMRGVAAVGYRQLEPVRAALGATMLNAYQGGHFDPELLRTNLAGTTFASLNVKSSGDTKLDQFSLSLLTEGSGTQIYGTTFVQWAAREALRRAQPLTLYAHFTPRNRERSMAELLGGAGGGKPAETDPVGSLIDADMGAYYTWLNQQRLPGADRSRMLVWFENRQLAVVVSPDHKRGSVHNEPINMTELANAVLGWA